MKKIIGILISIILIITSMSATAFISDIEMDQTDMLMNYNFIYEPVGNKYITDPCISPDNGYGTVNLPAMCPYIAPDDPMYIIDGLFPGTTMELDPTLDNFNNILRYPGGLLGGEVHTFDAILHLAVSGTGSLAGFNRNLAEPVSLEIHTGPRNPGDPIQIFPSDIFQLNGEIFGDPDFCTFRVLAGSDYGLPSPGQFTLTEFISGDFNVDSFFDITYQIVFEGCPGSILEGMSGITIGTIRIQQGTEAEITNNPPNKPDIPSGATSGKTGTSYSYSTSAIDPEDDQVYYWFDWGDGTNSGWNGPHNSGDIISLSHTWTADGTYPVKVKAKDTSDEESVWSDPLPITMPKNKSYNDFNPWVLRLIQRFPFLEFLL